MDRLERITRELAVLDAKRVPGFLSQENLAFWAALDSHWPTIRGMLNIARRPFNGTRPVKRSWLQRIRRR